MCERRMRPSEANCPKKCTSMANEEADAGRMSSEEAAEALRVSLLCALEAVAS